ncbi:MAG: 50S ribosomal protein L24 [Alphaproteobacteria bacterium]|nr:50S ribosomal protein L24 [Alphaproteobacteria bacterium]
MKIKKNDTVVVITGKDKGKTGMVKAVFPKDQRVLVVGVNRVMRHTKPSQKDPQGGRKQIEAPIHVSNVAHVDPKDNKATRAGFKTVDKGRKVRFARRSGETID